MPDLIRSSIPSFVNVQTGERASWNRSIDTGGSHASPTGLGILFLAVLLPLVLVKAAVAAPANDHYANRHVLSGSFDTHEGILTDATREPGEPDSSGEGTTWYTWTAPATGKATFTTEPSADFRKFLSIYVGSTLQDLTLIEGDATAVQEPRREVLVTAGSTYQIAVGKFSSFNESGMTYTMAVNLTSNHAVSRLNVVGQGSVANDAFSGRVTLAGSNVSAIGYNWSATREAGEPPSSGFNTLWWSWTAPTTGYTLFSLAGSDLETDYAGKSLAVFSGNGVESLQLLRSRSHRSSFPEFYLPTVAGRTYHIASASQFQNVWLTSVVLTIRHQTGRPGIRIVFPARVGLLGTRNVVQARISMPHACERVEVLVPGRRTFQTYERALSPSFPMVFHHSYFSLRYYYPRTTIYRFRLYSEGAIVGTASAVFHNRFRSLRR